ncbi:hypothetical protein [Mediterranea massiliensis]|uniref:hypothetical protein n=1 Tax=Mediterranea massiliensis TaxID=1841865 RepID=UPI00266C9998|nr:hypothetical protein [Mediterranea massiliensis]
MSKPVEIEFLMKDKLSDGIDNANAHIDTLIYNAKKAAELVNAKIAEQHKVIDGVAADLSRMERQLAGMKPGTAQKELAADVMACRKVLDEERNTLVYLEKQHRQAEKAVSDLEKEHGKLSESSTTAAVAQKTLAERIAESKDLVKYTTSCIKELEKAYKNAAPGNAQSAALAELNAAKKALEEEKLILASLTREQEENRESNKRLAMQLRELQNAMAKMRLEGKQDTEEYREMAEKAALLSDTIADLHTQTKILSNDDANLQGFMSGISGLSGMFTAATGAVSLFASENENLAKIQARVQSVMAVTMGLQQVFNTLNKDSAFRLVTVVKMKNLLTAANTRLAAALGISTAAASALMATLTLGLSAVITGLIVLFNKYSDAQEESRQKAQELIEVESEGRAQMIKTRFEIDNTIRELKEFTGSKEEEKKKTEELNRKYGEAFGYYDTVAEWYDVLTQKAADYIQMLFLQAKAQALVNKAVEADDKVNKLKATDADDVDGSMGWFKKSLLYFAQGESNGQIDASAIIKEENEKNKEQAIADAEKLRDDLLKQAEDLTKEMGEIGKNSNIGGHSKPKPEHKPTGGNGYKDRQKELEREKAAEQKRAEELARLRQENEQESIDQMAEGSAKRIRQIKFNYQKEESEIKAQEAKWRDAQGGNLTEEQGEALAERLRLAQEEQRKGLEEIDKESLKNELQAMVDYLREYGTLQEQKYAIAKEYAEKIREVNEGDGTAEEKRWQVRKLEKERDAAVSQTNAQNLALNIDWSTTFEGVGNVLKDVAKETLAKIEEYMQTSEFKKLSAENKKVYTDLQAKLKDETGGNSTSAFNFKIWDTIAKNVKAYQDSVRTLREKTDAHTQAVTDLEQAQQDLADATDDASKKIAQKAVDIAQGKVDATAASQNEAQEASDKARKTLTDNTNAAAQGIKNFTSYLNEMSDGSLYGFANGITKLITSLSKGSDGIGKSLGELGGKVGGIVGAILQILDALGDDPKGFINDLLDKVADTINKVVEELPEIIIDVIKDVGNIVQGLLSGIAGWFGIDDLFGLNGNEKEVKKTIENLTERTELLQNAIEDLTDVMEKSYGQKATDAYEQAKRNQEETNANYLGIAQAQAGYWKHHHSWNYYWNGFSDDQTAWIRQNVKENFDGSIWSLTPEEMKKLLSNVDIAEYIKNTGKGGYGNDVLDKLQDYADQAGKIEELTDSWRETITQISFDSMKDSFISNLMDMKKTSKDFAEDFATDMQKALLSYSMEDLINGELKQLYDDWAQLISDKNGELTEKDIEDFNRRYDEIVAEGLKRRDEWAKVTGYEDTGGTSQSAKSGGFTAMTQDQGTKLEGMFTSGLQHWSSMDERLETVADRMNLAESHLARIAENTGTSAGHLGEIKEDIRKIVRDGLKVK